MFFSSFLTLFKLFLGPELEEEASLRAAVSGLP